MVAVYDNAKNRSAFQTPSGAHLDFKGEDTISDSGDHSIASVLRVTRPLTILSRTKFPQELLCSLERD